MSQTYDSDVHWMLKLAANECSRLEEDLKISRSINQELIDDNLKLNKNIISLEQQLDNALQLCNQLKDKIAKYETEAKEIIVTTKQEIVTQPSLFSFEEEKHKVIMKPTRRALTSEQAQHVYNMVVMGNARITDMTKKFNCNGGTIANIISGISYKEIIRKD